MIGSFGKRKFSKNKRNILKTLSKFAIENDIDYMILGETRLQNEKDSVIFKLRKELGTTKTQIEVVPLKSN